MSNIFNTLRLWTAKRGDQIYVLAPGDSGLPEPIEGGPSILRARYLSPDGLEAELDRGRDLLDPPNGCLLVRTGDSEAPPADTALLFAFERNEEIPCKIGGQAKHVQAELYLAATKAGTTYVWNSDIGRGKFGYFQVGMANRLNLWKIRRLEADFANRYVFTIFPAVPSSGLPALDLSSIQSAEMRGQVDQHWREFVEVYTRQLPYRSVNAAKDVCEYLLHDLLHRNGLLAGGKHELGDLSKAAL